MAKLMLASSAAIIFFFCFLSLSFALASSSSDIPEATSVVAPRDTPYDDLIVLPSANSKQTTILPDSESEESSSVPVNENLFTVDLTEVKDVDTDDLPASVPLKEVSFHHHHHHHRPGRSGHKEISYGNDMILSSHESFGNSGFEEDEGFGEEDGGLRKFHHHHHHHPHHRFDHGEVEGVEDEKEGHPHGHRFHQRKFGGDEEHPFRHGFHHRHHHHRLHHHEEEEHEEGGLVFKLRKFLNGF